MYARHLSPSPPRLDRLALLALLFGACTPAEEDVPDPCAAIGVICTTVGTGNLGFNGDGRPADETYFYWTQAVQFDLEGRLVVADMNNYRVRRVTDAGTVETLLGNGFHLSSTAGLRATDSPVDFPADIQFLPDGSFYVAAIHENRVLWVDTDSIVNVVIGDGNEGYTGDGRPAAKAQLAGPAGLALAEDGTLYVADTLNHVIRVVTTDGNINTLAGRGIAGYGGDGGPAIGALLHNPTGLALVGDTLYVADSFNHVIRAIDLVDDTIRTVVGNGARGYSGDGGDALSATLYAPEGVTLAPDDTLWVADSGNHALRRILADGTIETVAGNGLAAYTGDAGPCEDAELNYPVDLRFDDRGNLYLADMVNGAVRVIHGASAW